MKSEKHKNVTRRERAGEKQHPSVGPSSAPCGDGMDEDGERAADGDLDARGLTFWCRCCHERQIWQDRHHRGMQYLRPLRSRASRKRWRAKTIVSLGREPGAPRSRDQVCDQVGIRVGSGRNQAGIRLGSADVGEVVGHRAIAASALRLVEGGVGPPQHAIECRRHLHTRLLQGSGEDGSRDRIVVGDQRSPACTLSNDGARPDRPVCTVFSRNVPPRCAGNGAGYAISPSAGLGPFGCPIYCARDGCHAHVR